MARLGRTPAFASLAVVLGLMPTGCDGGAGDPPTDRGSDPAVAAVVRAADATAGGVLRAIATRLRLGGAEGTRSFSVCGERYAPGGVVLRDRLRFTASDLVSPEEGGVDATALLRAAGWRVEDPVDLGEELVLRATRDRLVLRVAISWSLVQVGLESACVETSDDVARSYDDRPPADLGWPP